MMGVKKNFIHIAAVRGVPDIAQTLALKTLCTLRDSKQLGPALGPDQKSIHIEPFGFVEPVGQRQIKTPCTCHQ